MMHEDSYRTIIGLLLAGFLAGCAAPLQKPETKPEPHSFTTAIVTSGSAVPDIAQAGTAGYPAEKVQGTDTNFGNTQIYPGTGIFVKAPAPGEESAKPETGDEVMLNFDGADLREVVKAIVNDILKESYIMDPRVQGTISLHTSNPIPRNALMPTLETLLRMNGAAILKEEGVYKVVPAATAARGSITPQMGGSGLTPSGYSVQIVPLKFIAAKEMVKILEPFVSDAGAVHVDEVRNLVMLFGTERELRHLQETINMFDVDWLSGMSVGLFTLQNVDVKTAATDLDKIFGDKTQSPLSGIVKLVPIERLNAMLVITSQPLYLDQARTWIERMDRSNGASGGTRLFVYPVQNGHAEKLAGLLNEVFSKASGKKVTPPPTLAPGLTPAEVKSEAKPAENPRPASAAQTESASDNLALSQEIRVIADKDNNALLILASPSDYEKIEASIRRLDVVPRQVLIDVTIAEITLTDEFKFGLEWYLTNGKNLKGQLDMGSSGINTLTPGFSYLWNNPNAVNGVGAALNALATDSRVKVISSPHIMVTDNQVAKIDVGDRVPTTSQTQAVAGTTATTGIISSIQYLDTGILLSVTPHINAGGLVTMEIDQEVSTASKTTTSGIDSPTISKRSVQSTVVVKSDETMVLGGLITENKTKSTSGLPFLSQIPILGGLFGTQDYTNNRTELVILITPHMVSNSQEAQEVSAEFRKKMSGLGEILDRAGLSGNMPK
jgi:general secretion pathway protein D